MDLAIETINLKKYYKDIHAVDGIDLAVPKGSLFGFLGPNGAGKTTTISMLSTVLLPTGRRENSTQHGYCRCLPTGRRENNDNIHVEYCSPSYQWEGNYFRI